MEPNQATPPPVHSSQRLPIIIFSSLLIVIVAVGIVFALKYTHPSTNDKTAPQAIDQSALLSAYQTSFMAAKPAYAPITNGTKPSIRYQQTGKSYAISVLAQNAIVLAAKSNGVTSDASLSATKAGATFSAKGLNEVAQNTLTVGSTTYTTYSDGALVCQLQSIEGTSVSSASQTVACVDMQSITSEYATVDSLIKLDPATVNLGNYSDASRTVITSGSKQLSLLTVTGPSVSTQIAYVKTTGDWQYVAVLNNGDSSLSNGKFVPSDALTAAFKNPDYGDFLRATLEGSTTK